jgi:hypothetical protein
MAAWGGAFPAVGYESQGIKWVRHTMEMLREEMEGEWLNNGGESTASSHGTVHGRNGGNLKFDESTASWRGTRTPATKGGWHTPFLWLGRGGGALEVAVTDVQLGQQW